MTAYRFVCIPRLFSTVVDTEDCILLIYFLFKLFKTLYFKDSLTNCKGETLTNRSSYGSSLSVLFNYLNNTDECTYWDRHNLKSLTILKILMLSEILPSYDYADQKYKSWDNSLALLNIYASSSHDTTLYLKIP